MALASAGIILNTVMIRQLGRLGKHFNSRPTGRVSVHSTVEEGTTFTVVLPMAR